MNINDSSNISSSYQRPWLRDEIFASSLTAFSLYLTIALAVFQYNREQPKNQKRQNWRCKIEDFLSDGSLCLIAAIFAMIICHFNQVELRLGQKSDLACRVYQQVSIFMYQFAMCCLYVLLWTRQLKLYRHPALTHLRTKRFRVCSWIVLVGILGSFIGTLVSHVIDHNLVASPQGCNYNFSFVDDELEKSFDKVAVIIFSIMFIFQIYLLAMFAYPLIVYFGVCKYCFSNALPPKNQQKTRAMIIRLSICSSMNVFSDGITLALFWFFYNPETTAMFWFCMYTVNVIFNIVSVVRSFSNWKQRLIPCLKIKKKTVEKPGKKRTISNLKV